MFVMTDMADHQINRVVEAIVAFGRANGYPPAYRDLSGQLGWSPATVHRWVGLAIERGLVTKEPGIARSLRAVVSLA